MPLVRLTRSFDVSPWFADVTTVVTLFVRLMVDDSMAATVVRYSLSLATEMPAAPSPSWQVRQNQSIRSRSNEVMVWADLRWPGHLAATPRPPLLSTSRRSILYSPAPPKLPCRSLRTTVVLADASASPSAWQRMQSTFRTICEALELNAPAETWRLARMKSSPSAPVVLTVVRPRMRARTIPVSPVRPALWQVMHVALDWTTPSMCVVRLTVHAARLALSQV